MTLSLYKVRPAEDSDSEVISTFLKAANRHPRFHHDFSVTRDVYKRRGSCFLAFEIESSTLVAVCFGHLAYGCWSGVELGLSDVYVDERHRRKGLCRSLVQTLLQSCANLRRLELSIAPHDDTNAEIFTSLGFQDITKAFERFENYSLPKELFGKLAESDTLHIAISWPHTEIVDNQARFVIRAAKEEDYSTICHLLYCQYVFHEVEHRFKLTAADLSKDIRQSNCYCFTAYDQRSSRLVGICSSYLLFQIGEDPAFHIQDIFVEPEYRRQGIATGLLKTACRMAESLDIKVINLQASAWNTNALKLYEKLGFVKECGINYRLMDDQLQRIRDFPS